ncbi:hypothetical protein [Streptomyces sp. URMC 129]
MCDGSYGSDSAHSEEERVVRDLDFGPVEEVGPDARPDACPRPVRP